MGYSTCGKQPNQQSDWEHAALGLKAALVQSVRVAPGGGQEESPASAGRTLDPVQSRSTPAPAEERKAGIDWLWKLDPALRKALLSEYQLTLT